MDEPAITAAIGDFLTDLDLGLKVVYPYPIAQTSGGLPDVVVYANDTADAVTPPEDLFPGMDLQEAWWRIFQVSCSFMVGVDEQTEGAAEAAWSTVMEMVAKIRGGIGNDLRLGDRLTEDTVVSPLIHFDFSEPFIAREDQTKGRHFNAELVVASRLTDPTASVFPA